MRILKIAFAVCVALSVTFVSASAETLEYDRRIHEELHGRKDHLSLQRLIVRIADKHQVSASLLAAIIQGESSGNPDAIGDMNIICKRTGKPMRSRGLVQISDCYHDVTDEQAFNAEFAVNFLAQHLNQGKCKWWTVCRRLKS